jgi:hypothetical protein
MGFVDVSVCVPARAAMKYHQPIQFSVVSVEAVGSLHILGPFVGRMPMAQHCCTKAFVLHFVKVITLSSLCHFNLYSRDIMNRLTSLFCFVLLMIVG